MKRFKEEVSYTFEEFEAYNEKVEELLEYMGSLCYVAHKMRS